MKNHVISDGITYTQQSPTNWVYTFTLKVPLMRSSYVTMSFPYDENIDKMIAPCLYKKYNDNQTDALKEQAMTEYLFRQNICELNGGSQS